MSLYQIPNVTLCMLSGFINDFLGRKKAMLLGQFICLLSWIGIYFAHTYTFLILGRCVVWAGIGILASTTTIYLSDIALIRFRGITKDQLSKRSHFKENTFLEPTRSETTSIFAKFDFLKYIRSDPLYQS